MQKQTTPTDVNPWDESAPEVKPSKTTKQKKYKSRDSPIISAKYC